MKNNFTVQDIKNILIKFTPKTPPPPEGFKAASVLIPFYCTSDALSLIFMKRPDYPGPHGGQISFPGGSKDGTDKDDLSVALRETEEEFGIDRDDIEIFGGLSTEYTEVSKYWVTPFVGWVPYPYEFRTSETEVERLIIIPLSHLMDPANFAKDSYNWKGYKVPSYLYTYGDDVIWGLTARILFNFFSLLRKETNPE